MILNVSGCPKCGETLFAVEVKSWVNVSKPEKPDPMDAEGHFDVEGFDEEDADYAEPIDGGEIVCRACSHVFKNIAPTGTSEPEE